MSKSVAIDVEVGRYHHGSIDALLNIAGALPKIDLFEMTDARGRTAWR
jgi:hypothetical protein